MGRTTANKANMTKVVVEALTTPGTYYDEKQPGLVLNVSPKGAKSWGIYKWDRATKRPLSRTIGPWPAYSVDAARVKARELVHAMDRGELAAPPTRKDTLGDLADRYEVMLKATGAKEPGAVNKAIDLGASDWRERAADTISKADVDERHAEIVAKRGPAAAARFVKVLRAIYRHAELPSPAAKTKVNNGRARDRVATPAEAEAIRAELEKQEPYWRDYFLLSILTGARRSNVAGMRFEQIAGDVWTIPADEAKGKYPIVLPLVPEAVQIIERRKAELGGKGFVFPSDASKGRVTHTWEKWDEIRRAAGAPDLTQHDLRRTFISKLAEAGVHPSVAAKLAGHRNITTTLKHYTAVNERMMREALAKIT